MTESYIPVYPFRYSKFIKASRSKTQTGESNELFTRLVNFIFEFTRKDKRLQRILIKGKLLDELASSKASTSSGLSSVASRADAVSGHLANGRGENSGSPVPKYKDIRLISILQINEKEILFAKSRIVRFWKVTKESSDREMFFRIISYEI